MASVQKKYHRISRILIGLGCIPFLFADSAGIGFAVADGSLLFNRTRVWGNATLFDGSAIETSTAPALLHLNGGTQVRLAAATKATAYQRRLVLETGHGQLESIGNYEIEARSLRIAAGSPGTLANIKLEGDTRVTVAALRGEVRVANALGVVVARLESGSALTFEPQTGGASAPTRAFGCLLEKTGKFILWDQTTNAILELQGVDLQAQLGNRVKIAGAPNGMPASVDGASQVVYVADLKLESKGGCKAAAAKLGASVGAGSAGTAAKSGTAKATSTAASSAGAPGSAGIGTGTVAVIGGVAAAAAVGGLAAVGALPGQEQSPPTASR